MVSDEHVAVGIGGNIGRKQEGAVHIAAGGNRRPTAELQLVICRGGVESREIKNRPEKEQMA
jgi:hypothetical protein